MPTIEKAATMGMLQHRLLRVSRQRGDMYRRSP